jgi:hypothetical protein
VAEDIIEQQDTACLLEAFADHIDEMQGCASSEDLLAVLTRIASAQKLVFEYTFDDNRTPEQKAGTMPWSCLMEVAVCRRNMQKGRTGTNLMYSDPGCTVVSGVNYQISKKAAFERTGFGRDCTFRCVRAG